jgi:glutathione S-transferase
VIDKALDSVHFRIAVARMELLLTEMEEALAQHAWLVGPDYTIADAAFTPYLARLDHLNILGMTEGRPKVAGWYQRITARPSFQDAIVGWENADYLTLMHARGDEAWPKVQEIVRSLRAEKIASAA